MSTSTIVKWIQQAAIGVRSAKVLKKQNKQTSETKKLLGEMRVEIRNRYGDFLQPTSGYHYPLECIVEYCEDETFRGTIEEGVVVAREDQMITIKPNGKEYYVRSPLTHVRPKYLKADYKYEN